MTFNIGDIVCVKPHTAYHVSMNGDEWYFGEDSLIDAGYSVF